MSSFCIVKLKDVYTVEEQTHDRGYATYEEAEKHSDFMNREEFQYVSPLGKGTNKIGVTSKDKLDDDRDTHNEKVKRRFKLKD